MTSIYMPSSSTSGGGSSELAGQVYGNTSNTIISTAAVTNKQLTGLSSMTGAVTASDTILTGISKLSGNVGEATSDNIANQIVKRDGNGGFSAGVIKITLPLTDSAGTNILDIAGTNSKYGKNVLPALTTGTLNLAIGDNTMPSATTAVANTFIGYGVAGSTVSNGSYSWNTGIGMDCLSVVAGNNNTAVGHNAGRLLTTGSDNICIGVNAGHGGSQT